jgi:hypothetical protein
VAEFEKAYAQLLGATACLATASGTTALMVSLHVMDVDAGDEVIVSPYTFIATYNAVLNSRALPVFADTDPATMTIDPASIESRITDRTRAILPVHIFGMPCEMDAINAIARKHKLAVVEDACQAWLAEYKGRKCGTLGDLGCFSFQESKHIPSGEGGARGGGAAASGAGEGEANAATPEGASRTGGPRRFAGAADAATLPQAGAETRPGPEGNDRRGAGSGNAWEQPRPFAAATVAERCLAAGSQSLGDENLAAAIDVLLADAGERDGRRRAAALWESRVDELALELELTHVPAHGVAGA